jgi:putative ABC transport system permease protein
VRQAYWVFATLVSHWRRHPLNFATLLAGLAIATALWSGVQALNQQARASYDRAAAVFGESGRRSIVSAKGAYLPVEQYALLRRAGWKVSPVLEGSLRLGGHSYRLIGVEPLTVPKGSPVGGLATGRDLQAFLTAPGQALAAPETLTELGVGENARLSTESSRTLPPLVATNEVAPGLLVVDVGVAQSLLGRGGLLSRLIVSPLETGDSTDLTQVAGDALRFEAAEESGDLARLTDSFHLNLTAFGFLAFIVGLFIVYASIGLAFEQRLATLRTMRAVGVPLTTLMAVLVGEVVLIALLAGAVGLVCGYVIAAALLPNVAASLEGLYGAHVGSALAVEGRWWISGLGMALAGALLASATSLVKVARLPVLAIARPLAWREAQHAQLRRQGAFAACCLVLALAAFWAGQGLAAGFTVIAGVLLGVALLLPLILATFLRFGERQATGAIAQWFWADTRQQLSGLSLALMALLLALSANIGVGTMVEGFRKTFVGWLDERLNSEVYFDAANAIDGEEIVSWLRQRPDVSAVLPVWKAETRIKGWPVDVYGTRDHATYREHFSLLSSTSDAWDRVRDGKGVLVSEQLARRMEIGLGDRLAIPTADASWELPVVGLYPDYGNPKGQVRVNVEHLMRHWTDARRTSYSLRVAPGKAAALIDAMQTRFGRAIARIVDQASLKAESRRIFERTFAVTAALNTLTLVISGIALFASLLTLSDLRLTQLAPVWALGVPRRRLADLEIGKLIALAAVTAVIAVPLGLVLAWCLVAIVNVQAFGWRLPFHVFPEQWLVVLALAIATAALAAMVPILKLNRTAPQDLLKVFANER